MRLRTITKIGVLISVVLFGVGVAYYSFARLSEAERGEHINLYAMVPDDCIAVLESNNINYFFNEMAQAAYADRFDSLKVPGLVNTVLREMVAYAEGNEHGLSRGLSYMLVSFHEPVSEMNQVLYFKVNREDRELMRKLLYAKTGVAFDPKVEVYRGKEILIYPVGGYQFVASFAGPGFFAVSVHKRLIEKVIDAMKDGHSLLESPSFAYKAVDKKKTANFFMGLTAHTASMPFLEKEKHEHCWSEFDFYMNSEVFYLSGAMHAPDSCKSEVLERLYAMPMCYEKDSLLMVSGEQKVDSCITDFTLNAAPSLFTECVKGMSRDAAFVMVADMDKVAREPERYAAYLPRFIRENMHLFRSFIMSVQLKPVDGKISHIFIFTYKK